MGGRWSLVQIQSPRPFSSAPAASSRAGPRRAPRRLPSGPLANLAGLPTMIAWVAYRIADLVVRLLPAALADRVCVALARLVFHAGLPARHAQEANLARLLGDAPRAAIRTRARESFEHFALALSDVLRLDSIA